MPKKNLQRGEKPDWKTSDAKKLLELDLISGEIPLQSGDDGMDPMDVYLQRPEFSEFPYEYFRGRLLDMRKQITEKKALASVDAAALANDQKIHPKSSHSVRGEPRWDGSAAQQLLKNDIKDNKHKTMTPKDLHKSRSDYFDNYPLSVFRKHIDQEVRRQRIRASRQEKNNPKYK